MGASSIYWAVFKGVSPVILVEYRIVFSLLIILLFLLITRNISVFWLSLNKSLLFLHMFAAILVAVNWGTFIWASTHSSVLESGIGYLVAPVVTIIIGQILFKEKMPKKQLVTMAIIIATIIALIILNGELKHWIYLLIAITWGGYTVLKKKTSLSPVNGLFLETIILSVILIFSVIFIPASFHDNSVNTLLSYPLIAASGIISVFPLFLFSIAAQKLSSYSMGLLQFVLPTTQVVVSYFYFGQLSTITTYICLAIIWVTLFVNSCLKNRY